MKIAYIYFFPGQILAGPGNKIEGQAKVAREAGLAIDFFVLHDGEDYVNGNVKRVRIPYKFQKGIFKKIEQTFLKYKYMRKTIDFESYDSIILRYPLTDDFTCAPFFYEFGYKIITEHHTNELAELKLSWNQDVSVPFRILLERLNAGPMLSKVAGIIGMTEELRKLEVEKAGQKPSTVIANGIDTEAIKQTGVAPFNGKTLKIVFTVSESAPWQGLDRLLRGLEQYRGHVAIHLILIGDISRRHAELIYRKVRYPVTVHMPGILYGHYLDEIFSGVSIAVSTLGLYRKKMKEACPLKSREYVARGLPFIYAYDDPDIPADCKFALKFSNDDTSIDIERVIDFAEEVSRYKDLPEEMRRFARGRLDWRVKLGQMYNFSMQVFKHITDD